jgi:hypothetical protein
MVSALCGAVLQSRGPRAFSRATSIPPDPTTHILDRTMVTHSMHGTQYLSQTQSRPTTIHVGRHTASPTHTLTYPHTHSTT